MIVRDIAPTDQSKVHIAHTAAADAFCGPPPLSRHVFLARVRAHQQQELAWSSLSL